MKVYTTKQLFDAILDISIDSNYLMVKRLTPEYRIEKFAGNSNAILYSYYKMPRSNDLETNVLDVWPIDINTYINNKDENSFIPPKKWDKYNKS